MTTRLMILMKWLSTVLSLRTRWRLAVRDTQSHYGSTAWRLRLAAKPELLPIDCPRDTSDTIPWLLKPSLRRDMEQDHRTVPPLRPLQHSAPPVRIVIAAPPHWPLVLVGPMVTHNHGRTVPANVNGIELPAGYYYDAGNPKDHRVFKTVTDNGGPIDGTGVRLSTLFCPVALRLSLDRHFNSCLRLCKAKRK